MKDRIDTFSLKNPLEPVCDDEEVSAGAVSSLTQVERF
jgi:hypothetical protein